MAEGRDYPRVGIVTQARVGSTRLPAKVLKEVRGRALLEYHLTRLKASGLPVFVATTFEPGSEEILKISQDQGCGTFMGPTEDVLARFYECAKNFKLDVVVRVTSDCPLFDGKLVAQAVHLYLADPDFKTTYLSNVLQRQFPRGFDFEIFSFEMLKGAFENAHDPVEREHVTPYLYRRNDPSIHLRDFLNPLGDFSHFRLTVDVPEDFELIKTLIEKYECDSKDYQEIITVLNEHSELADINRDIVQKKI